MEVEIWDVFAARALAGNALAVVEDPGTGSAIRVMRGRLDLLGADGATAARGTRP